MRSYSRRELYAAGEFLGNSATQNKLGGGRIYGGGGGGGGPTTSTVTQSNIPDWLRPQTEALLGGATKEYFNTRPVVGEDGKTTYEITGIKPYVPYSTNPQDYVAGFTPQQQQVFAETANMYRPEQYGMATRYADMAGYGGLNSVNQAYEYGNMGAQSGMLGQDLGIQGGARYGQTGADIGLMGLQAQDYGRQVGDTAQQYARQAAAAGEQYRQQATDPYAVQAYMSPYQQGVTNVAKAAAQRQADIQRQSRQAQAVKAGAFGGSRQAIEEAEANRALNAQLQGIETQGLQNAYDRAIQSMQYGSNLGLQGLSGAQQGLGTALQGGQLGLSGLGTALQGQQVGLQGVDRQLAGTAQGMQGAQVGLQGVSGAQAGYGLANQAAQNLANIGTAQQQADLSRLGFQNQIGTQQQQQEQNIINQAINNYAMAQNYPQQQLAGYNALLRGYATPTTTTQSYQAVNPMAQLAGLTATGIGAYGAAGGFRAKGGVIKEKHYDVGGSVEADLESIADEDRLVVIAKTSPSAVIRKKAAEILAQRKAAEGITGVKTNLPAMYAPGGIIAFSGKEGSDVKEPEFGTPEYDEKYGEAGSLKRRLKGIKDYYASPSTLSGVGRNISNTINALAPFGAGGAGYRGILGIPTTVTPGAGPTATGTTAALRAIPTAVAAVSAANTYGGSGVPTGDGRPDTNAPAAPPAPVAPPASPDGGGGGGEGGIAGGKYEAQIQRLMEDLNKGLGEGRAQKDLDALRAEMESNKDRNLWTSIMKGGAKMMQAKGPNFLGALGEGAEAGIGEYGRGAEAERADKKLLIAQQSALEQAEYARKTGNFNALIAAQTRLDNVKAQRENLASYKEQQIEGARMKVGADAYMKALAAGKSEDEAMAASQNALSVYERYKSGTPLPQDQAAINWLKTAKPGVGGVTQKQIDGVRSKLQSQGYKV